MDHIFQTMFFKLFLLKQSSLPENNVWQEQLLYSSLSENVLTTWIR